MHHFIRVRDSPLLLQSFRIDAECDVHCHNSYSCLLAMPVTWKLSVHLTGPLVPHVRVLCHDCIHVAIALSTWLITLALRYGSSIIPHERLSGARYRRTRLSVSTCVSSFDTPCIYEPWCKRWMHVLRVRSVNHFLCFMFPSTNLEDSTFLNNLLCTSGDARRTEEQWLDSRWSSRDKCFNSIYDHEWRHTDTTCLVHSCPIRGAVYQGSMILDPTFSAVSISQNVCWCFTGGIYRITRATVSVISTPLAHRMFIHLIRFIIHCTQISALGMCITFSYYRPLK